MPFSQLMPETQTRTKRIIGHIEGTGKGPTLVFFGGIHGNEPSGVEALKNVFSELENSSLQMQGSMYGIQGNSPALVKDQRFLEQDLNRIWTRKQIQHIKKTPAEKRSGEELELMEILTLVNGIFENNSPPFYFIDFHTTSSKTLPFITINDAMINRKFSRLFPVPIILGIEEYLEGPLLSYINELGYVSLGFESGQHHTEEAVVNSIAFTWLALEHSGFLKKEDQQKYHHHFKQLQSSAKSNVNFYEVIERYAISSADAFKMKPGFESFDIIEKDTLLATNHNKPVYSPQKGILFMPLYQKQGAEGFFIVRQIPKSILKVSAFLRRVKFDKFLTLLPGVYWENETKQRLMVNIKVARFFNKPFFHLLGYRNRTVDKDHLLMSNRENTAKNEMYEKTPWF
jgi:succinylglutamate desuccinylase